ncbi:MAG: hypothetical protein RML36_05205 [Anaerolineae bacterium]|nr:hypothetical protein [Anaerolineae bacterium]MDW8098873.1 hypothetical protein [Anaerolineae bacterium]
MNKVKIASKFDPTADMILDIAIAKERIHLAEIGKLRIRPMERSVYDPDTPEASIPPKVVHLSAVPLQPKLLESLWPIVI